MSFAAALLVSTLILAGQSQPDAFAVKPGADVSKPPTAAADPAKVAWLQGHEIGSGPVTGQLQLHLPRDLLRAKLILLGESHGAAAPQVIDLALLTELNRRIGLRDYVAEVDPVQGAALNLYLDTGDERVLTRVFSRWKGKAQWGNTAFMDKVRGVRTLNQRLAPARRVRFLGLDAIQDWPMLVDWLEDAGAKPDIKALDAAASEADRATLAAGWLAQGAGGEPALKARLAQSLRLLAAKTGRERIIFETYAGAVRSGELGDRPAYGLWGLFHVMQARLNGACAFACQVKGSDLPGAKSLRSIVMLALDSSIMIPGGAKLSNTNIDGPLVNVPGAATLRAASRGNSSVIWALEGKGSPYASSPDLVAVETKLGQSFKPDDPALPTTAYAQYGGVFRNSDWAPPLP